MAVFGSLSTVRAQLVPGAKFNAAYAYLAEVFDAQSVVGKRVRSVAVGSKAQRIELPGGLFAMEQAYLTKLRADCFFESHQKFIDIQVVIEGEEFLDVIDITKLTVTQPFLAERDLIKYADSAESTPLHLLAGDVAVLFPVDGHQPGRAVAQPVPVRKVVVKVPVEG
jgi:biofilm protein TabA